MYENYYAEVKKNKNYHFLAMPSNLNKDLKDWVMRNNISNSAFQELVKILKPHHPSLKSAQTLLKPLYSVNSTADFIYCGIVKPMSHILSQCVLQDITLQFNIDGLPLFHSSSVNAWPILCDSPELNIFPFVVALFVGKGKPSLELLLSEFVTELTSIFVNGFRNVSNTKLSRAIFVFDLPAKKFIKCTSSFNGYNSCDHCSTRGTYSHRRMTFQGLDFPARTNESFRSQIDENHHTGSLPLLALPINMVDDFPVDYLHCICLGVMRRFLYFLFFS